jgi:hypothetical protein
MNMLPAPAKAQAASPLSARPPSAHARTCHTSLLLLMLSPLPPPLPPPPLLSLFEQLLRFRELGIAPS